MKIKRVTPLELNTDISDWTDADRKIILNSYFLAWAYFLYMPPLILGGGGWLVYQIFKFFKGG